MNSVSLPHPNNFLVVESLNYPNPYDFNTPHRHDYFEIILIREGGGEQLIDFTQTGLQSNCVYTVYPGQIHLLKRENAEGLILQFRKDIFDFIFPIQYHYLYFPQAGLQLDEDTFRHLYGIAENIRLLNTQQQLSPLSTHHRHHLPQYHNTTTDNSLNNENYDNYCYLPLYVFCGHHLLAAKLRPANIDASAGTVEELERIVAQPGLSKDTFEQASKSLG